MQKKSQNILITGATSGIGEALALHYAETSANFLFLCGRSAERLSIVQEKCKKQGVKVHVKILDVTDKTAVENWIEECENIAPLNLVIANAGVATLEETPENIYNTFNTNVNGVLHTIIPTIEIYKKRSNLNKDNKAIAIVSSIAGYHGLATCPSYSASKACVKAWGEGLRIDLKRRYNINVSVICPGFVKSGITDKNTCPMPFLMETDKAAALIAHRLEKNVGLIAFPWAIRFASWLGAILPNRVSEFIYSRLPYKV